MPNALTPGADPLDRAFLALADPVRRAIVARLARGDATVNELAGLVSRSRDAQRRPVHLEPAALERLTAWIDRYRLVAEDRFRRLDALLLTPSSSDPHPIPEE